MTPPNLPDISAYAAPLYVAFIVFEIVMIYALKKRGAYESRDTTTSLLMGTGNVLSTIVFGTTAFALITAVYFGVYQFRLFDIGFTWWAFLLAFVLDDFLFYWSHRLQHTIRWGWASHVIHHSSQHFNLSTALRQPWFDFVSFSFVLAIPLLLIGFHPAMVAFVGSLNLLYQFFVHTEAVDRLPRPIEAVMNTPSHHRVHHGKNPRYLDANYAGVFIVWDRLFGTFVPERADDPVRYGLVKDIGTFNPLRVATHEYVAIAQDVSRRGLTLGQRLAYVFARPGWSHDGSRKTSTQIKAAAGLDRPPAADGEITLQPAE
jgi:sterol desaturase/sphingolipid hydroxylase (fatty acid hydroxylase superfamily)